MRTDWLEPWTPMEHSNERSAIEGELERELNEAHPLFGLSAVALARRHDQDDVLFEIDEGRVAEVHLTWRSGRESDPRWPSTKIYESVFAWVEERMRPQHEEWRSND
jgi:hypothetical protein